MRSPQVNAFCLPGGKIVVYTGILKVAGSDAGLATVMGHEMAHATARHGSERLLQQKVTQTLMTGVQFSLGDMSYEQQRAVMGGHRCGRAVRFLMPFGRNHESEADKIGLLYMARAGYDPREAIAFWERMGKSEGQKAPPEFMSTHPSHGTRIERLKAELPAAMAEYERTRKGSPQALGRSVGRPRSCAPPGRLRARYARGKCARPAASPWTMHAAVPASRSAGSGRCSTSPMTVLRETGRRIGRSKWASRSSSR